MLPRVLLFALVALAACVDGAALRPPASCLDISTRLPATLVNVNNDGKHYITFGGQSFLVDCASLTTGDSQAGNLKGFTKVFRQKILSSTYNNANGYFLDSSHAAEWNTNDPDNVIYSILTHLDDLRQNDTSKDFVFKFEWPSGEPSPNYQSWQQSHNPNSASGVSPVSGYSALSVSFTGNQWGGLAISSQTESTYIDGSPTDDNWWYSVGMSQNFYSPNGIPGPSSTTVSETVLFARASSWSPLPVVATASDLQLPSTVTLTMPDYHGVVTTAEVASAVTGAATVSSITFKDAKWCTEQKQANPALSGTSVEQFSTSQGTLSMMCDYGTYGRLSGWTRLLRQGTSSTPLVFANKTAAQYFNEDDPLATLYSVLDVLEDARTPDGRFVLRITWPGAGLSDMIWYQTLNPVTGAEQATVTSYEEVQTLYAGVNNWGGLEKSNSGSPSLLDGSSDASTTETRWWYAIGATGFHGDAIPAAQTNENQVELWVWTGSLEYEVEVVPNGAGSSSFTLPAGVMTDSLNRGNGASNTINFNSNDLSDPVVSPVSLTSNHAGATDEAALGDTITLTFSTNEEIQTPVVKFFTTVDPTSLTNPTANDWVATLLVDGSTPEGVVTLSISATDLAGNSADAVTTTTDSSSVTVDRSGPSVDATHIQSDRGDDATIARTGDTITLNFDVAETVLTPTATFSFNGGAAVTADAVVVTSGETTSLSSLYFVNSGCEVLNSAGQNSHSFLVGAELNGQPGVGFTFTSAGVARPTADGYLESGNPSGLVGSQACFLQGVASIEQQVTGFEVGASYRVRWAVAKRTNHLNLPNSLYLDITQGADTTRIFSDGSVGYTSFTTVTSDAFTAQTTSITFRWSTTNPTGQDASLLMEQFEFLRTQGQNFAATYEVQATDANGPVTFEITALDALGNQGTDTTTSDSSSVTRDDDDITAPVVSPVSIVSNNTDDPATAVNGDLITLTFSTDEDVGSPTVTIAGRAATVTGGPRDWTATIVSQAGDPTGTVQFSITDVTDAVSNTAAEVTVTTDSSQVVRGCGDFTYGSTCSCEITPGNDLTEYPMDLILYTETDTPPAWTRLEDGKLHIVYDESIHYSTAARVFNNTDDLCSQHWTWTSTVDEPSCTRTWEGEMIWANWEDCDIERSTLGDDIEFLVNFGAKATEVIPGLRDGPETRTVKHIMPFTLGFPTRVIANSSDVVAFSPVVEIGAIVEQTLKGTPGTDISMDVSFLTSVQWPFVLKSATWGTITADDNGAPDAFSLETTAGSCDDNNATEPNCQNTWSSTVYPASQTTTCELDGQYTVNWVVDCHDSVKASNDCPIDTNTDDATLTFTIDTSSFCVQVADTVTLSAAIYTYEDAAHTILKDDFLDGQTVYAEVPTSSDKVSIDSTRVVDATIVRDTEANIGLIVDGDIVLPNDYAVARADGGSSAAGVSSRPSFQFTVNTASTHMDLADDSSETMTLAATVSVRYQNAGQAAFSKVRFETALQTKEKDVAASTSVGFGGTQSTTTGTSSAASSEATIMGVNAMVVYGAGAIMALVLITAFVVLRRSDPTPTVDKSESQVQLTSTAGETSADQV